MEDFAIRATGISKKYFLQTKEYDFAVVDRVRHLISTKKRKSGLLSGEFFALKDLNFEIKKGEAVGIIGYNGAGKSTLLKLLSEVVVPTEGKIDINGTVASVLEMGMGFHPELTGRENIFLSGMLLGIPKKIIENKYEEIIEFSGISKFMNSPVKFYSSGMFMRLAFSIAVNIDADILLFDEVFAVGDISFQMKCKEKIKHLVLSRSKTILFVSHNVMDIIELCTRVIYLENGKIMDDGGTNIISKYYEDALFNEIEINQNVETESESKEEITEEKKQTEEGKQEEIEEKSEMKLEEPEQLKYNILFKEWPDINTAPGDENIKIRKMYILNESDEEAEDFYINQKISVNIEFERFDTGNFYDIGIIMSYMNFLFLGSHTLFSDVEIENYKEPGKYIAKVYLEKNFFNEALFFIGYVVLRNNKDVVCANPSILRLKLKFFISEKDKAFYENMPNLMGPLRPKLNWELVKYDDNSSD